MLENELLEKIKFLFGCDFFSDDFDPDGEEIHSDANNDLIENYDKKVILDCSLDYFYSHCKFVNDIINFCNLFFYYGYQDIDNPHAIEFLGYIFSVINYDDYPDTYDFIDSFACSVMEHNKLASLYNDPYYAPEKDERIIKAIEVWKNKSYGNGNNHPELDGLYPLGEFAEAIYDEELDNLKIDIVNAFHQLYSMDFQNSYEGISTFYENFYNSNRKEDVERAAEWFISCGMTGPMSRFSTN